ncbi:MAG: sugar ABC transporter permease [Ruminococcaceae bacterium]|nr:sugar ABC transporter permease [Oscillospiraceae bacterium]
MWDPSFLKDAGDYMKGHKNLIGKLYKPRDNVVGYLMLAPWLIGFLFMWLAPAVTSMYYSFTDFNLLNTPKLIGFDNYIRIFTTDKTFIQALKITFIYVLLLERVCKPSR